MTKEKLNVGRELALLRWKKTTKKQRSAHAKMMSDAYWKPKKASADKAQKSYTQVGENELA